MQAEAAEAVIDLTTVYREVFPHANADNVRFTNEQITQVVLFRRELGLLEKRLTKNIARAVRHDTKDAE